MCVYVIVKQSAREGNNKPRKNTRVDAPRDTSPRDTSPTRDTKQKNFTHAPGRRRSDEETFLSMESTLGNLPSGKRRLRFRLLLFHSPGRILLAFRKLRSDFMFLLLLQNFCRHSFLLLLLLRTHVVFFFFKLGAGDGPTRSQRSLKNDAFGARKTVLLILLRDGTTNTRSQRAYHSLFFLKMCLACVWDLCWSKKDVSGVRDTKFHKRRSEHSTHIKKHSFS